MSKNWILILIVFTLIIWAIYIFYPRKTSTITQKIKDQDFSLEVAKTIPQRTTGLMNRPSLCPNCGMLFVFEVQMPLSFWMKNTLIPLDIIFLDSIGKVINIGTGVPQSLAQVSSLSPAKYVIELPSGTAAKIGLLPGDTINLVKSDSL